MDFPAALYMLMNSLAAEISREGLAMVGLWKAPRKRRSCSSWRIVPKASSCASIMETPDRTILVGNDSNMAFSILSPFWSITIMVCPGVTAGAMSDWSEGGMSGQFLVTVRM